MPPVKAGCQGKPGPPAACHGGEDTRCHSCAPARGAKWRLSRGPRGPATLTLVREFPIVIPVDDQMAEFCCPGTLGDGTPSAQQLAHVILETPQALALRVLSEDSQPQVRVAARTALRRIQ